MTKTKLYNIPRESKLRVELHKLGTDEVVTEEVTFHHIDGMYSYITDKNGVAMHLSASTPMKLCEDGVYEIDA